MSTYLLLFFVALVTFSISAVSGGGAGLMLLPLLGLALPATNVPAALSIGTAFSSVSRIAAFRNDIRLDVVVRFVPPAIPAVWLGAWLLKFVSPLYLEVLLGLFLVANLPLAFRPARYLEQAHPFPKPYLSLIGVAAGFVSGLTGAVGLLFNRFYLRYGMRKEEIVATRAANEIILHLIKLGLYTSFGLVTQKAVTIGGIAGVAAIVSAISAKRILPYLSEGLFRRIGYLAMVAAGLAMCVEAGNTFVNKNRVSVSYSPFSDGVEAKLQWKGSRFALEFEYDEGFEYERSIHLSDLPSDCRSKVTALTHNADRVLIEEVFGMGRHGYEVIVLRKGDYNVFHL